VQGLLAKQTLGSDIGRLYWNTPSERQRLCLLVKLSHVSISQCVDGDLIYEPQARISFVKRRWLFEPDQVQDRSERLLRLLMLIYSHKLAPVQQEHLHKFELISGPSRGEHRNNHTRKIE
jgi:hypothetical protein